MNWLQIWAAIEVIGAALAFTFAIGYIIFWAVIIHMANKSGKKTKKKERK